jgi:hypothetical protein
MKVLAERLGSTIPLISLVISAMVAWLIVPPITGFPMVAFFIFFVGLSSLVYMVKKKKAWLDTWLYSGILLLAFFTIYRANDFLQFFDFICIVLFGSVLISPLIHEAGIFDLVLAPLKTIKNALISKNIFPYTLDVPAKYRNTNYFREYLPTIAITGLIMLITIPLLASANPFFNALLQNFLKFFNLDWLFRYLFADQLPVYVIRVIGFLFLAYFIPRVLTITAEGTKPLVIKQFFRINYLIPKIAMAVLLMLFFITQAQLYFASAETLRNLGYTNSRLTNEVFAQVTIVAFIVFLLVYLDKSRKIWNTRLAYFLIIEAFFLIAIAFKSVYDYTSLWGFTQKRLWGYTSMGWLTGALLLFTYHYRKQTSNLSFLRQVLTYTMAVVLLINIVNFDYLIYHYAKASTSAGVDHTYLARLSPDAHHYRQELPKLVAEIEKSNTIDYQKNNAAYMLLSNIDFLRSKYSTSRYLNAFNISEYQEYLATQNIDVEAYRQRITTKQQQLTPTNLPN